MKRGIALLAVAAAPSAIALSAAAFVSFASGSLSPWGLIWIYGHGKRPEWRRRGGHR